MVIVICMPWVLEIFSVHWLAIVSFIFTYDLEALEQESLLQPLYYTVCKIYTQIHKLPSWIGQIGSYICTVHSSFYFYCLPAPPYQEPPMPSGPPPYPLPNIPYPPRPDVPSAAYNGPAPPANQPHPQVSDTDCEFIQFQDNQHPYLLWINVDYKFWHN